MPSTHHVDDECAKFDIEQELNVLGFENPVIASDLESGDYFQDPAPALADRWYQVRHVEETGNRWVHVLMDDVGIDELDAARCEAAYELIMRSML